MLFFLYWTSAWLLGQFCWSVSLMGSWWTFKSLVLHFYFFYHLRMKFCSLVETSQTRARLFAFKAAAFRSQHSRIISWKRVAWRAIQNCRAVFYSLECWKWTGSDRYSKRIFLCQFHWNFAFSHIAIFAQYNNSFSGSRLAECSACCGCQTIFCGFNLTYLGSPFH